MCVGVGSFFKKHAKMLSGNVDVLLDESEVIMQQNIHINSYLMCLATISDANIYGRYD